MRWLGAFLIAICASGFCSGPAAAEKRVALVIGNSAYQSVPALSNPANDSDAMSGMFKGAGFDVVELKHDLKAKEMRRALRDFSDVARDADVAIIYYAGHGIEIDGANYLVPTDAVLERDLDAFDEAVPLDRLLTVIESAKKLRLVILDACRDNPFAKRMRRSVASRSIGRGLAKVEPDSPNTLIAYAAKAGSTAMDGDSKNSPFTTALVKYLPKPGLDLRKAFGFARDEVLKATNNEQEPFIYGSLGGDDFPLVTGPSPGATPSSEPTQAMRRDYEFAERVGTQEAWESFLSVYPQGFYAKLAQAQRNKLIAEQSRAAAAEKARLLEAERARLAAEGAKASEQAKAAADAKAAEQARIAADNKKAQEEAKLAEAERAKEKALEEARVASETKRQIERTKADEAETARLAKDAKAAEEARIAAEKARVAAEAEAKEEQFALEKAKALVEVRAAEVARIRADAKARAKADDEAAAAREAQAAERQKAIQETRVAAAEQSRLEAESAAEQATTKAKSVESLQQAHRDDKPIGPLAALTPHDDPNAITNAEADTARLLQIELYRVGCATGPISGTWDSSAQKSLKLFNTNAGSQFDVKVASIDALERVRKSTGRICPMTCDHGYRPDGDTCVKIVCKDGYELSDENSCEQVSRQKGKRKDVPITSIAPEPKTPSSPSPKKGMERADSAARSGTYQKCMGALPGCYQRAIRNMTPDMAQAWCNRKPTC